MSQGSAVTTRIGPLAALPPSVQRCMCTCHWQLVGWGLCGAWHSCLQPPLQWAAQDLWWMAGATQSLAWLWLAAGKLQAAALGSSKPQPGWLLVAGAHTPGARVTMFSKWIGRTHSSFTYSPLPGGMGRVEPCGACQGAGVDVGCLQWASGQPSLLPSPPRVLC